MSTRAWPIIMQVIASGYVPSKDRSLLSSKGRASELKVQSLEKGRTQGARKEELEELRVKNSKQGAG